jgi:hypothetical protein
LGPVAFVRDALPVKEHEFSLVGINREAEPVQPGKKKGGCRSELLRDCGEGGGSGINTPIVDVEGQVLRRP